MTAYPTPDESFARLHRAGWSVGEVAFSGRSGRGGLAWGCSGLGGNEELRGDWFSCSCKP